MPAQVWRLMIAYALMMSGTSLMVLIAGIIAIEIAPSPGFATLPLALTIVGLAVATLPTGKLQSRFGRKRVFLVYGFVAVGSTLLAVLSLVQASFWGFCTAAVLMGWSAAAGHQYRFAAMESVAAEHAAKATSVLLFGGILAAVVGPEIAVRGRYLMETEFAGSYLLLAAVYIIGIFIIIFYHEVREFAGSMVMKGRSLVQFVRSPVIVLAVSASAVGYGLMSFVMTAGPVSMHEHAGHDLQATKWVLQSHIAAMYLPSLVYPWLFGHWKFRGMMWAGICCLSVSLFVASLGTQFIHYWLTLVTLGIGWNFLFLSGTNLLRYGYHDEERFKAQSLHDFTVFSFQGLASLGSGWFLYHWGWQGVIFASVPLLLVFALLVFFSSAWPQKGITGKKHPGINQNPLNS